MPKPLYSIVKEEILSIVQNPQPDSLGASPHAIFFTELGFVQECSVSRTTVRKAVDELVREQILVRVPGKGVRVCEKKEAEPVPLEKKLAFILYFHANDHVFSDMFIGLSQAANYAGFSYYLYNLAEHEIENIIEQLKANRVDGILLAYNSEDIPASAVTVLLSLATPVVFMDNIPTETEKREIYSVLSDDWQGGFMCASALLTKGHRKVVYILPEHAQYTQQRRAEGFLSAFSHFESAQVQLFRCQTGIEQELEPFLAAHPDCTAIACPSDGMVVECYRVLDKLGIEYPTEMSLVGYNDIFYSAREKVPIATVRQPFYDMGRAGSKMMIEHLEKGTPMKNISFDVEFIERMSVARAVERKSGL